MIHIHASRYWDPVKFIRNWNCRDFYDALYQNWPLGCIVYVNPPYSECTEFLIKAAIEYLKGCNIILLLPVRKNKSNYNWAKFVAQGLGETVDFGQIAFKDYNTVLFESVCAVFLLQPDVVSYIERKSKM